MKKIVFLLFIALPIISNAQKRISFFSVPHFTTPFNDILPINTYVVLDDSVGIFRLSAKFNYNESMSNVYSSGNFARIGDATKDWVSTRYINKADSVINTISYLKKYVTPTWVTSNFFVKNSPFTTNYGLTIATSKISTDLLSVSNDKTNPLDSTFKVKSDGTVYIGNLPTLGVPAKFIRVQNGMLYQTTFDSTSRITGYSVTTTNTITGDYTWTNVIPAKYMLEYVVINNTSLTDTISLDLGTTAGTGNVFLGTILAANSYTTISTCKVFSLTTATSLYLSDDAYGGSYWKSATISTKLVYRKID